MQVCCRQCSNTVQVGCTSRGQVLIHSCMATAVSIAHPLRVPGRTPKTLVNVCLVNCLSPPACGPAPVMLFSKLRGSSTQARVHGILGFCCMSRRIHTWRVKRIRSGRLSELPGLPSSSGSIGRRSLLLSLGAVRRSGGGCLDRRLQSLVKEIHGPRRHVRLLLEALDGSVGVDEGGVVAVEAGRSVVVKAGRAVAVRVPSLQRLYRRAHGTCTGCGRQRGGAGIAMPMH
mmetsp:Transcript_89981/g.234508  ORF Transcript_89981/g.234508 Transcript_89981/m.234508 type:complete len:230 (+) Transcript_89981:184-873(+)